MIQLCSANAMIISMYNCIGVAVHVTRLQVHQRIHRNKIADANQGVILEVARMQCGSQQALEEAVRAGRVYVP